MDPVNTSTQEKNIQAVKTYSKVFLGHGYNRLADKEKQKLLGRTLEDFSLDRIDTTFKQFRGIFTST